MMDGGNPLLEWEVRDEQRRESRMIHAVINQCWRHPYELMFCFLQIWMVTYRNIYRYVYTYRLVYTHIVPYCQLRGTKSSNTSVARSILVPRTWFLKGEIANSRSGAGNTQDESGTSCSARLRNFFKKYPTTQTTYTQ